MLAFQVGGRGDKPNANPALCYSSVLPGHGWIFQVNSEPVQVRGWGGRLHVALGADGDGVLDEGAEAAVREVVAVVEAGGGAALGLEFRSDGRLLLGSHGEAQLKVGAPAALEVDRHGAGPDRVAREHPR